MSLFNLPIDRTKKPEPVHPWAKSIKAEYSEVIKYAHNSINNDLVHPKSNRKEKKPSQNRCTFRVIGDRVTKEFIYCCQLVKGMHKYRWKYYDIPIITGVTSTAWPQVLTDLKARFGDFLDCQDGRVAVLSDDKLIGGASALKDLIEMKYIYHVALNYQKESTNQFKNFINASGISMEVGYLYCVFKKLKYIYVKRKYHLSSRSYEYDIALNINGERPCAYLHISIDDKPIGTLIFMLYSDIVPNTCENFLRLCEAKRGGYSGTPVHRIVKDGWIQCGGYSLKSTPMDCENFLVPFDRRGVIGMANEGRHMDCSTQFFVLLQPNEWLETRFVAFGQLIEGEETLKKIEAVKTFYESPAANVMIYGAGILSMECRDATVNQKTMEYMNAHIEDLISLGQILYELLMENVFVEINFRVLQSLEPRGGEDADEEGRKDIRATQRFMRRKEEIETQLAKSQGDPRNELRQILPPSKGSRVEDVEHGSHPEENVYEVEEYAYSQETPPASLQMTKDFFLPLTDVPYPGEVDSNFDLKRFVGGDYCLEADLEPKMPKKLRHDLKDCQEQKLHHISGMMSSYGATSDKLNMGDDSLSLLSDVTDSEEEEEIRNYLKIYGEKVSFTGKILTSIAQKNFKVDPLKGKRDTLTDEEIRRVRIATEDVNNKPTRKVSICADPWKKHKRIIRRQTGFIRAHATSKDDVDDEPEVTKYPRSVSINAPDENHGTIKRIPTGLLERRRLSLLKKVKSLQVDEDELKPNKVRISPLEAQVRATVPLRRIAQHADEAAEKQARQSVLVRLYKDVAALNSSNLPTFRDFISISDIDSKRRSTLVEGLKGEHFLRRTKNYFNESDDQEVPIQYDFKTAKQLLYEKIIKESETKPEISMRATEFARMRPSLTVSEYRQKYLLEKKYIETETKTRDNKKA